MTFSAIRRGRRADRRTAVRMLNRGAWLLVVFLALTAGGCKSHREDVLRVGVAPGPAVGFLHSIEPELAREGWRLFIVPFSGYLQPNMAWASHDVDANLYQNAVFLNQFNRGHQTHFVSMSKVYLPLMAIY